MAIFYLYQHVEMKGFRNAILYNCMCIFVQLIKQSSLLTKTNGKVRRCRSICERRKVFGYLLLVNAVYVRDCKMNIAKIIAGGMVKTDR